MESLKHNLSVAACFARLAVQRQLEYPLFLVSWFLMIPIYWISGVWMLKILVDRFQPLAGWTFPQLSFVYGLGLLSHGIMVVFFVQTWNIESMVIRGGFDRMLLRPMNVFFQFCVNYINFIGLFDLFTGLLVFIYGCRLAEFQWSFSNTVKLILVVLGGVLIRAAFYIITGSIAFWTKRSRSLVVLGQMLMQYSTTYPIAIYPYAVQVLLTFVIPVGFISFYPACDFLGQNSGSTLPLNLALWTPAVGIVLFAAGQLIFHRGLKRYESAGS